MASSRAAVLVSSSLSSLTVSCGPYKFVSPFWVRVVSTWSAKLKLRIVISSEVEKTFVSGLGGTG